MLINGEAYDKLWHFHGICSIYTKEHYKMKMSKLLLYSGTQIYWVKEGIHWRVHIIKLYFHQLQNSSVVIEVITASTSEEEDNGGGVYFIDLSGGSVSTFPLYKLINCTLMIWPFLYAILQFKRFPQKKFTFTKNERKRKKEKVKSLKLDSFGTELSDLSSFLDSNSSFAFY